MTIQIGKRMVDSTDSYKIIKGVLSKDLLNIIDKTIFGKNFKWYYNKSTIADNPKKYKNSYEHFQFTHWIIVNSEINSTIGAVLAELIKPLPFNFEQIVRAKLNLLPQYKVESNRDKHNIPHTDLKKKHKVAIIYLDDSDGFTYLFNDDATVLKKIKPQRGQVLLFNGRIKHAGSHPIDSMKRVVFNIYYINKKGHVQVRAFKNGKEVKN